MPTAIVKIVDGFPFPTIEPIFGTLTYNTIAKVNLKLNSNAASVKSNLSCSTLGLLQLTVSPAIYNTLLSIAFIMPVNPVSIPIVPSNSNGSQITKLCYAFDTASSLFNNYDRTDKALRQFFLSTVEKILIRSLRHKYVGYGLIATRAILDHLYATYANISSADIQENYAVFRTPYDINQRIESLFYRVENCGDYADAGNNLYKRYHADDEIGRASSA